MKVNIFASNKGWLFEDLKQHFQNSKVEGIEVLVSDSPLSKADVWVALRTGEAHLAPCLKRTIVCFHDLYNYAGMYTEGGGRGKIRDAGGLVLSHPQQKEILKQAGISLQNMLILERPLGALSIFQIRQHNRKRFCVGWVGRNIELKRLPWFIEAIENLNLNHVKLHVNLIGRDLQAATAQLEQMGISCNHYAKNKYSIFDYPALYQQLDCLVITSSTEAGPLTLFEALATGIPVISTPVGWAVYLSQQAPQYIQLVESPAEITSNLRQLSYQKEAMFEKRFEIASLVEQWSLDSWFLEVLQFAASLEVP